MWEEPRPERLRQIESTRRREFVSSLIAYTIIFGVAAVLLYTGVIDWRGAPREKGALPAPAFRPAAPTPPQHRPGPTANRTAASERVSPEPATSSFGPTNTARGDSSVLRTLTDTCRYWAEQNTRGQYSGNQEMACRDMAQYARTHGYAVPPIRGSGPSLPSSTRDASPTRGLRVAIEQCESHGYGSISYRQCRAVEKRRLTDWCTSLRTRRDNARGGTRDTLSQHASAVCSEADRYQIVR